MINKRNKLSTLTGSGPLGSLFLRADVKSRFAFAVAC